MKNSTKKEIELNFLSQINLPLQELEKIRIKLNNKELREALEGAKK